MSNTEADDTELTSPAKIAVVGCGWWSQGWHLPHLWQNENSTIIALVDINPHPRSPLNPGLLSMQALSETYRNAPVFSSIEELLESNMELDGILVATPHSTHAKIGKLILQHSLKQPKPVHIMMEKPMTTCVEEAKELHDAVVEAQKLSEGRPPTTFLINHSANFRKQCLAAHSLVLGPSKAIGKVQHIAASFASPLMWIFDNPANPGWNEPTHTMLGNGFAWGQQSHLLAWIYYVTDVIPIKVSCHMHHSSKTGADLSHAATIYGKAAHHVEDGDDDDVVVMSLSGTTLLPGNAHSDHGPIGKEVHLCIYGSEGAIRYCGTDSDPSSGQLELRRVEDKDGHPTFPCENDGGFLFENLDPKGDGPESLKTFIAACQGTAHDEPPAADVRIGLRAVQTLDAMYRSHHSGQIEHVKYV